MGLNELKDVGRIIGETLFVKLASIEAIDKQSNSPFQGLDTTGKTTRTPSQTSQIVTQFGIVFFHRIGIGLSLGDCVMAVVIPQAFIGIKGIAMIVPGFRSFIHHVLDHRLGTFPDYFVAQKTARRPIYDRDEVDRLFFSPMNVKSSSISATLTSSGTAACGKLLAFAWTQSETV